MFCNALIPIRRSSRVTKIILTLLALVCLLFCFVGQFTVSKGLPESRWSLKINYEIFMKYSANQGVLFFGLILFAIGTTRYRTFERVRRNPRSELSTNIIWLIVCGCVSSCGGTLVFLFCEFVLFHMKNTLALWSTVGMIVTQLFMMTISVSLLSLLASTLRIAITKSTPLLIALFAISNWLLAPFSTDLNRYVSYFWYPLSQDWKVMLVNQALPFCGFCLVLFILLFYFFERVDRLDT